MGNKRRMILSGGTASGSSTFDLTGAEPRLRFTETDRSADKTLWDIDVEGAVFSIRTRTDADGTGVTGLSIIRGAGTAITSINTGAPLNVMGTGVTDVNLYVASTGTADPRGIMSAQYNTGVDGARLHLRKARGTEATPLVIVTGDTLGRIVASGYDGDSYELMASIDFVSTGTIADTRVPTQILFKTATNAAPSVLTTALTLGSDQAATFANTVTALGLQTGGGTATASVPIFSQATSGNLQWQISNSAAGNSARIYVGNATGSVATSVSLRANGTAFSTSGLQILDGGSLTTGTSLNGGLAVGTEGAFALVLGTNDTVRMTLAGDGTSLILTAATNLLLGASAVGTSGVTVLAIKSGTAPSTAPADTLQIFSEDVAAGQAVLSIFQEYAPYAGAGVASTHKVPIRANGVTYYVLATTVQ